MTYHPHSNLYVEKIDEVYLQVTCEEPSILYELVDYFTFEVDGHTYSPKFREKKWDGKIRLFSEKTGKLYVGLFFYLQHFCNERGYTIHTITNEVYGSPMDQVKPPIDIDRDIHSTPIAIRGKEDSFRDYQVRAIQHALTDFRTLLLSSTGSGKSGIIYGIIRYLIRNYPGIKILIIVPVTSLVEQMYSDFEDYSTFDDTFSVKDQCHRIYSELNAEYQDTQQVIISTWQSLINFPKDYFTQFGCVIGDEAHRCSAKSLVTIMKALKHAKYRIGTTGSLDGIKVNELVIQGLFGPIQRITKTKELMERGVLAQLKINIILLKHQNVVQNVRKYNDEVEYLISNEKRNGFIRDLALDLKGNTLLLFNYVEKHGVPLFESIRNKAPHRSVYYISGITPTEEREQIRGIVENEENAIIVASVATVSTGINIRNLHNLISAFSTKSQVRVLQSIGRGLRVSDNQQATTLYDITDDLTNTLKGQQKPNHTLIHAGERIKIYAKESFNFQIFEVDL